MSKYWEIVQLVDGSFALQHPDDEEEEPLVTISFSKEAKQMMEGKVVEVAQAMIGAGVQAVSDPDDYLDDVEEKGRKTVH